jgi:multiple sugar transport system permease protein
MSVKPNFIHSKKFSQYLFMAVVFVPMAAYFMIFIIIPMFMGIWGSFTDWAGFSTTQKFVGLANYTRLLGDKVFLRALLNTFLYLLMYLPAAIVLGLSFAFLIEATGIFKQFFRTVYFLPVITSTIATALVWAWLYQPSLGLFNMLLKMAGLQPLLFLRSESQALPSIVVYALWKNMGYVMVLFMAGLSAINRVYYDAAKVDGAGTWPLFRHITIPLLRPTFVFVLITGLIDAMKLFGPVLVMTTPEAYTGVPGGPKNATMVLSLYQWIVAFKEGQLGYGAAMGVVLFLLILGVTIIQLRTLRVQWEY